eukprot:COSAG02_NODE_3312_length_6955_cov_2.028151_13_plen_151_part_00
MVGHVDAVGGLAQGSGRGRCATATSVAPMWARLTRCTHSYASVSVRVASVGIHKLAVAFTLHSVPDHLSNSSSHSTTAGANPWGFHSQPPRLKASISASVNAEPRRLSARSTAGSGSTCVLYSMSKPAPPYALAAPLAAAAAAAASLLWP